MEIKGREIPTVWRSNRNLPPIVPEPVTSPVGGMEPSDFRNFFQTVDDFMLPSVSRWYNYERNVRQASSAPSHFALPICARLDDQSLVGGLGVDEQQNVYIFLQLSPTSDSTVQMSPRYWQLPQAHPYPTSSCHIKRRTYPRLHLSFDC